MTAVLPQAVTEQRVREALGTVVDPELDEPITDLGFVRSVAVSGDGGDPHTGGPHDGDGPRQVEHAERPRAGIRLGAAARVTDD